MWVPCALLRRMRYDLRAARPRAVPKRMRHMSRYYILFDRRRPLSGRSFRVEASVGHINLGEAVDVTDTTQSVVHIYLLFSYL